MQYSRLKSAVWESVHAAIRGVILVLFSVGLATALFGQPNAKDYATALTLLIVAFPLFLFIDLPLSVYRKVYVDKGEA